MRNVLTIVAIVCTRPGCRRT